MAPSTRWRPELSPGVLRTRSPFPHDQVFFEVALGVEFALARLRLQPRRRSASRWQFQCPICHEPSGTFLALSSGGRISCRYGCSRDRIRRLIENALLP
jgi:hypothetical protein